MFNCLNTIKKHDKNASYVQLPTRVLLIYVQSKLTARQMLLVTCSKEIDWPLDCGNLMDRSIVLVRTSHPAGQ